MIRLISLIFALAATVAPLPAQDIPATVPTTQPALTGRWEVYVTPAIPSPQESVDTAQHLLIFDQERMRVQGPIGNSFGSAPYEYRPPDFRAVFDHDQTGNALWAGEVTDEQIIRGRVIWTRHDGQVQIYHFAGQPADE